MQPRLCILLWAITTVASSGTAIAQDTLPVSGAAPVTMRLPARVTGEHVNVRSGPGESFKRLAQLNPGVQVMVTARQGNKARVTLADGRIGWMPEKYLRYEKLPSEAMAAPLSTSPTTEPKTAAGSVKPSTNAPSPSLTLEDAKPDPTANTSESPAAAMGGAWRLLLYLAPVLALVVLAVRGLKAFYHRTGGVPITRQGLLGGFNLLGARAAGGSNIRVVESVPIGTVGLHLVDVRGRLLLIGSTGTSVTLLAEFRETESAEESEFRALLNAEAAMMENGLLAHEENLEGMIGSLDDSLRDVREAVTRNAARLRRWSEGEQR